MHDLPSSNVKSPILAAFVRRSSECLAREASQIAPDTPVSPEVADTLSELTQGVGVPTLERPRQARR